MSDEFECRASCDVTYELLALPSQLARVFETLDVMQQRLAAIQAWTTFGDESTESMAIKYLQILEHMSETHHEHAHAKKAFEDELAEVKARARKAERQLLVEQGVRQTTREELAEREEQMKNAMALVTTLQEENQKLRKELYAHAAEHGMAVVEEYDGTLSLVKERKKGWFG